MNNIPIPVALLCGGLGKRMHPITHSKPKSLIDVCGRSFIDHQLELLRFSGFNNIIICAGHFGKQIQDFVGNGNKWDLNIKYSFDGNFQIGTGGALIKALNLLGDEFFVMYGDSYLPINYKLMYDFYKKNNSLAVMAILENNNMFDKSNVKYYQDNINIFYSKNNLHKMNYIDYGVSILRSTLFKDYKNNQINIDLSLIFEEFSKKKLIQGYQVKERFYEIGSFEGLSDITKYFEKIK